MPIESHHWSTSDGTPAGGSTFGPGFAISWQNGPLGRGDGRKEPNGAFVENIIHAAVDRLEYYQRSRFASDFNAIALINLNEALAALKNRTAARESRGVEGTSEV